MVLKILYEDDTVAVLDKPAGVDVAELGEELSSYAPPFLALGEELRFGIVHRLDKNTSGILIVAKTKEAFQFFQNQFKERAVQKEYICLVEGNVKAEQGAIETLLDRSPADRRKQRALPLTQQRGDSQRYARTEYAVERRFEEFTLLCARPKTGRKHQIRVHMAHLGHPIAGDTLYGFKNSKTPAGLQRQFLHASSLSLPMPDGSLKEFHSDLPKDLQVILDALAPYHMI